MTTNGDRPTPPHGFAPTLKVVGARVTQHDSDISELRASVSRVEGMVGGLMGEVGGLAGKVDKLNDDVRHALRATIPPPRGEAASGVDLRAFAEVIKQASLEGERRPDSTPDEEVEKALERVQDRQLAKRTRSILNKVLFAVGGAGVAWLLELIREALKHT